MFGLNYPVLNLHVERLVDDLVVASCAEAQGYRGNQEDAYNMTRLQSNLYLFGVYDGHGGPGCAQHLSKRIPTVFANLDVKNLECKETQEKITRALVQLDTECILDLDGSGSTCVIVLAQLCEIETNAPVEDFDGFLKKVNYDAQRFMDESFMKLLAINIGDSRAMVIKNNSLYNLHRNDLNPKITKLNQQKLKANNNNGRPVPQRGGVSGLTSSKPPSLSSSSSDDDDDEEKDDVASFEYWNASPADAIVALTEDHKPEKIAEVYRVRGAGGSVNNGRVDGSLAVSRAFGDGMYKSHYMYTDYKEILDAVKNGHENESFFGELKVTCVPDYTVYNMQWGSLLYVSCDGLYERCEADDIADVLMETIRCHNFLYRKVSNDSNYEIDGYTPPTEDEKQGMNADNTGFLNLKAKKLQFFDYDPALPARASIKHSIEAGSKDNHTAMCVVFKPPMIKIQEVLTQVKQLSDQADKEAAEKMANSRFNPQTSANCYISDILPRYELIPGVFRHFDDEVFQNCSQHDMLSFLPSKRSLLNVGVLAKYHNKAQGNGDDVEVDAKEDSATTAESDAAAQEEKEKQQQEEKEDDVATDDKTTNAMGEPEPVEQTTPSEDSGEVAIAKEEDNEKKDNINTTQQDDNEKKDETATTTDDKEQTTKSDEEEKQDKKDAEKASEEKKDMGSDDDNFDLDEPCGQFLSELVQDIDDIFDHYKPNMRNVDDLTAYRKDMQRVLTEKYQYSGLMPLVINPAQLHMYRDELTRYKQRYEEFLKTQRELGHL